jgi:hypothetical protein
LGGILKIIGNFVNWWPYSRQAMFKNKRKLIFKAINSRLILSKMDFRFLFRSKMG